MLPFRLSILHAILLLGVGVGCGDSVTQGVGADSFRRGVTDVSVGP